jgi:hypothetical protein
MTTRGLFDVGMPRSARSKRRSPRKKTSRRQRRSQSAGRRRRYHSAGHGVYPDDIREHIVQYLHNSVAEELNTIPRDWNELFETILNSRIMTKEWVPKYHYKTMGSATYHGNGRIEITKEEMERIESELDEEGWTSYDSIAKSTHDEIILRHGRKQVTLKPRIRSSLLAFVRNLIAGSAAEGHALYDHVIRFAKNYIMGKVSSRRVSSYTTDTNGVSVPNTFGPGGNEELRKNRIWMRVQTQNIEHVLDMDFKLDKT